MDRPTSGALIDRHRRAPGQCLYCTIQATSAEHAVPQAIGGRLWANILCPEHNRVIGTRTDEPFTANVRPLVNLLRVRRHDGNVGVSFDGVTDDGRTLTVTSDGRVPLPALEVEARDERRRITRAKGDLSRLDALMQQGAFATTGTNYVIATIGKAPPLTFEVGSDRASEAGVLKIALHFFSGFIADVPRSVAEGLLPFVLGDQLGGGSYVRTPPFDNVLFPSAWPPRHEVTCFPAGDSTYVSVLLFDAYPYLCRLPVAMVVEGGIRYRQPLLGAPDPQFEIGVPVPEIDWERRLSSENEQQRWGDEIMRRLDRISEHAQRRELLVQCEAAAKRADARVAGGGDFWEWYRAELQLECIESAAIERILTLGRRARARGKEVWEFDVVFRT